MEYANWHTATFLNRPNRFIAHCQLEGREVIAHVKNTGRCRELLVPGCQVFLQHTTSPHRKTQYDLYAVNKNGLLINMDSSAPNQVFWEQAKEYIGKVLPEFCGSQSSQIPLTLKREVFFSHSRFDFFAAQGQKQAYIEVKGVTLEQDGVVLFPDAPTARGEKHVYELIHAVEQGFLAYLVFIVQLSGAKYFTPNGKTHPSFAEALKTAQQQGVHLLCYDCQVSSNKMTFGKPLPICL